MVENKSPKTPKKSAGFRWFGPTQNPLVVTPYGGRSCRKPYTYNHKRGTMDTNTFNTTALQDELTGALVGLARAADTAPAVSDATWQVMIEALAANSPAAACNEAEILSLIDRVHAEKFKVVPDCAICASPCGRTADYNMANIWNAPENVRSLKVLILLGVHGLAGYAHRALALGVPDDELNRFFAEALATIGEELSPEYLQPTLLKTGEMVCKCKVLLDKASAETSSPPSPAAPAQPTQ